MLFRSGFVGGYWGYKSIKLNSYLLPLCDGKLNVKIFGNSVWPTPYYLGHLNDKNVANLFRSAIVAPNVSECHSTEFGFDLVERIFKVPAAHGFLLSDHVDEIREVFGEDEVPTANNPTHFRELVEYFVMNPDARLPYIQKAHAKVMESHTYFERVAKMFFNLGLYKEICGVEEAKRRLSEVIP